MYSLKSSVSRASRSNGAYPLQAQTIVDVHQHGNNDLVIDKHWPLFLSRETSDLMVDFRVGNPSSSNAPSSSLVAQRGPLSIARHTAMLSLISAGCLFYPLYLMMPDVHWFYKKFYLHSNKFCFYSFWASNPHYQPSFVTGSVVVDPGMKKVL